LPLLAVGNAKGDIELLDSAQPAMLVRHDDADREYAYDDQDALSAATSAGWTIVSIRDDFGKVFGL
jgi:YD repeat-containing protein